MINFIPETNNIIGYIFFQIQGLFQIFSLTQKPYSINGLKFPVSGFLIIPVFMMMGHHIESMKMKLSKSPCIPLCKKGIPPLVKRGYEGLLRFFHREQ